MSTTYGDPHTRQRILDVAVQLAGELGPSMRLADVARAAGVSHQGLYLHFRGRSPLLLAMLPHMQQTFGMQERFAAVAGAPDGRKALGRLVDFFGFLNERLDAIGWVLEEAQHLDEDFGRDWRARMLGLREVIRCNVVARLADEGSLRSAWTQEEATDLFLSATTLGSWRELTRELGWSAQQYRDNLTRLLEKSLLRD